MAGFADSWLGRLPLIGRLLGPLLQVWDEIDAQMAAARALQGPAEAAADRARVRQILVVAAVLLVLGYSFGDRPFFQQTFAPALERRPRLVPYLELLGFTYWSVAKLLGYGLLPLVHARLLGDRPRDLGLGLRPAAVSLVAEPGGGAGRPRLRFSRTYLLLVLGFLPVVFVVSRTAAFQENYPFYRLAGRSLFDFLAWELQYLSTFVAVEFFFRGYLLFGLLRPLGTHALFVSMVPYCMIHMLKPAPEALGSIAAGLLLGTLALGTGSLWCGALVHITIALSMDLFASFQAGTLPSLHRFF
jgi:membrane protease YdiL (CAAX protease family)